MNDRRDTRSDPTLNLGGPSTAEEPTNDPLGSVGQAMLILIAHPDGQQLGLRTSLDPDSEVMIGRDRDCKLAFPDVQSLSRVHARLSFASGAVVVEDLGSTNGTLVNDRRIGQPFGLTSGDRLQCGGLHFKFLREADVEAAYHLAIHQLVMQDGLTELANRRKFDDELAREFARATRHQRPLSLVVFDVDRFKEVNDNLGHLGGDAVLKNLAVVCRRHLRPEQLFARIGGDEFAVVSPEMNLKGTLVFAERLRAAIEAHRFESPMPLGGLIVTCSFGCAQKSPEMRSETKLLDAADRALYAAKQEGRNRIRHL